MRTAVTVDKCKLNGIENEVFIFVDNDNDTVLFDVGHKEYIRFSKKALKEALEKKYV